MSRPRTAVTNSAVESSSTLADEPRARARPSGTAGSRSRRRSRRRPTRRGARRRSPAPTNRPSPDRGEREPDETAQRGTEDADVADQRLPRRLARRPAARDRLWPGGQPSIAGTALATRSAGALAERGRRWRRAGVATADDLEARRSVARVAAAAGPRHDRPREPEPGGLAQPPLEAADRAQLAEQPDLADRDGAVDDRPVAQRRGQGERERQVEAGLVDGQAAGEVGVDVVAAEADAGPPAEDRDEQASRLGSMPLRLARRACRSRSARRAPGPRRAAAGCPRASARRRCPGAGSSCSARNARAGSATSRRPASPISNTPTSSVDPKRFFVARSRRSAA